MTTVSIDAGTTTIKAVGYDDEGIERVVARRATRVVRSAPGWAEQDMEEVWSAVVEATAEAIGALETIPDLISVTAQGDGAWLIDDAGRPTGPAMLWNDGRAAEILQAWEQQGVGEEARRVTGSPLSTGMPNALLAWLGEHDRARVDRSATLLTCGGWIFHRLTGARAMDHSDAAAPFLDVRRGAWAPELLERYGIAWVQRLLPELRDDGDRVAELVPLAATALGLPAGTPVVLAPYDLCTTAIGAGAFRPSDACCILGTTLSTQVVLGELGAPEDLRGLTVPLGIEGRWLQAFPTMAGGDVLAWVTRLLGLADVTDLFALAAIAADAGAPGTVQFLPYLSPAGERFPFSDPSARGSLTGLSLDADASTVAHAVVLGLTHTIRECLEAAGERPTSLTVSGGSSLNATWRALIADVLGVPVRRPLDHEVGARGARLVAALATGREPDLAAAVAREVVLDDAVEPDPGRRSEHDAAYAAFLALRDASRAQWSARTS